MALQFKDGTFQSFPVKASSTVTEGDIVAYNATGILTATNAGRFAGIATKTGVAADDIKCMISGSVLLGGFSSDLTAGDLLKTVYHLNGALTFGSATGAFPIGVLMEVVSLRTAYIKIDTAVGTVVA